ncbi:Nitroreductase family protein [Anaerocolumna jejuensis DSM 15929]|uniref:Nitroreductase family protein n=1 Tax=Anaerocolumna jejuensis DSM 15929 TaxID=1121322 RepID=A0A1M6M5N4_9FIRM|nr:nitroreductase family protein [Anaerocolumna jejuensis]SHJ78748.1 Nitroreductase family protein [Anaerocolumna jejuensis DSM 15929]
MDIIFNRRSIRRFQNRSVEKEKVERLLRAGMQAPSAGNQQPWEFIVVEDHQALEALSKMSPYSGPVASSGITLVLLCNSDCLKFQGTWQQELGAAA